MKVTAADIRKADAQYLEWFAEEKGLTQVKCDIIGRDLFDLEDELSAGQWDCLADAIEARTGAVMR